MVGGEWWVGCGWWAVSGGLWVVGGWVGECWVIREWAAYLSDVVRNKVVLPIHGVVIDESLHRSRCQTRDSS